MRPRALVALLGVAQLGACTHTHLSDSSCTKRAPDLITAVQAAASAVHKQYHGAPPADFDAKAYVAAARAYPLADWQIHVLESVELEVWTKADCRGAIVVARCPTTKRVILSDDTTSTSRVEQPNLLSEPEPKIPEHPSSAPVCPVSAPAPAPTPAPAPAPASGA